jgi:hypothetical protein
VVIDLRVFQFRVHCLLFPDDEFLKIV